MRKILIVLGILTVAFISYKSFAAVNIDNINVNFPSKHARITESVGEYVNDVFVPNGQKVTVDIEDPAFTQSINTLTQQNALNMDAVVSVLSNVSN